MNILTATKDFEIWMDEAPHYGRPDPTLGQAQAHDEESGPVSPGHFLSVGPTVSGSLPGTESGAYRAGDW